MSQHTPADPALVPTVSPDHPDAATGIGRRLEPAAAARRRGALAVLAGSVLWGTTGVVVRSVHAATGLSAAGVGCYRLALAAAVLAVARPGRVLAGLRAARPHGPLLLLSALGLAGYQALYFLGVQDAGVGIATLLSIGVAPVVTTLATALARRRRPAAGSLAVLAVALTGLILVSLPGLAPHAGGTATTGVLAAIGSGTGYGLTVLVNRRVAAAVDAVTMTVVSCGLGAALLLPAAVVAGPLLVRDGAALAGLGYLGAVSTALAYGLFYAGLRTTGGEVAVVLTLLEPLTAAALAVLLLHERLVTSTVVGGMLMLGCVVVLYLRPAGDAGRRPRRGGTGPACRRRRGGPFRGRPRRCRCRPVT